MRTGPWARSATALAGVALLVSPPAAAAAQDTDGGSTVHSGESQAQGRAVVADGHVDLGPRFVDGEWTLQVRDDTVSPAVWRDLPDVVLHAADTAAVEVPDDERFAFLGTPGDRVWMLPQVQQDGVLWPGWNTQDPEVASSVDREVTWTLYGAEGPGDFTLFLNTDFGDPQIVFDGGGDLPQETGVDVGTHAHGNWAFTAPGTYLLDIGMSATTLDGEQVADRGFLAVHAGEEDPEAAFDLLVQRAPADDPDDTAAGGTGDLPGWVWAAGGAGAVVLLVAAVLLGLLLGRRARNGKES